MYVAAKQAILTGHFVRSVTTSYNTKYFMREWRLASEVSVSLLDDEEIYLATLEQPIPLTDIKRLEPSQRRSQTNTNTTITTTSSSDPCAQTYGTAYQSVTGFSDDAVSHDVLCISKGQPSLWTNENTVLHQSIIVDVELLANTSACSDPTRDRVEWQTTSATSTQKLVLCISRFNGSSINSVFSGSTFVSELLVASASSTPENAKRLGDIQFDNGRQLFLTRSSAVHKIDSTTSDDNTVAVSSSTSAYVDLLTSNRTRSRHFPLKARLETNEEDQSQFLTFRIVQFADVHFTGLFQDMECRAPPKYMDPDNCTEALMPPFMGHILDLEKPDLVVFTGDNTHANTLEDSLKALDYITKLVEDRGIPFAMVFGNHDVEFASDRNAVKLTLMQHLMKTRPYFVGEIGPEQVDGVGNYVLRVSNPINTSSTELSLYFLDSHDYPNPAQYPSANSAYDFIHQSQIDLYLQKSDQIRHESPQTNPMGLMFFHIPLMEFALDSDSTRYGTRYEVSSPARVNSQLVDTLLATKEVKAVFVGHDHGNEFCYLHHGLQLCYGGGIGFGRAYGDMRFSRRSRVIEWRQDVATKKRELTSWKRLYENVESRSQFQTLYVDE